MSITMDRLLSLKKERAQKQADCDNQEGMYCSGLEHRIACQLEADRLLLKGIQEWRNSIFIGEAVYDSEDEDFVFDQLQDSFRGISELHAEAVKECASCNGIQGLCELQSLLERVSKLRLGWKSPELAVAPSYRTTVPHDVDEEIRNNIRRLLSEPSTK